MARRPDETPEPTHRNSEPGRVIIARTGDDGNRKQAGNFTPLPPAMKLLQIIRSHQPDEAPLGVAADQRADRIDGKPRAEIALDRGRSNGRAAGGVSCRTTAGAERGQDGKHVVWGKKVVGRVVIGGRLIITKQIKRNTTI